MNDQRKTLMSVIKVKINEIYNQIEKKENISFAEEFKLRGLAGYYEDNLEELNMEDGEKKK